MKGDRSVPEKKDINKALPCHHLPFLAGSVTMPHREQGLETMEEGVVVVMVKPRDASNARRTKPFSPAETDRKGGGGLPRASIGWRRRWSEWRASGSVRPRSATETLAGIPTIY